MEDTKLLDIPRFQELSLPFLCLFYSQKISILYFLLTCLFCLLFIKHFLTLPGSQNLGVLLCRCDICVVLQQEYHHTEVVVPSCAGFHCVDQDTTGSQEHSNLVLP